MKYLCADEHRRALVRTYTRHDVQGHQLNGLNFLEVEDIQHDLRLRFLKPLDDPAEIQASKLIISGGERVRDVSVVRVIQLAQDELLLTLDKIGDFSQYLLQLDSNWKCNWFDPCLSTIEFSFRIECRSDTCAPVPSLPPALLKTDSIDYLAKDYASFRRLMLDRLAAVAPNWQARSEADLGMALVELLAYAGDYLSYQQDAIAAEAYLDTARRRASVRRHVRLVDYSMHDGCNARVWVQVQVDAPIILVTGTGFATQIQSGELAILPNNSRLKQALSEMTAEMFAAMQDVRLDPNHNLIEFYTWGDDDCVLTAGSTRATLLGRYPNLQPSQIVILAELEAGLQGSLRANPARSQAVRLTAVDPNVIDPLGVSVLGVPRGPGDLGIDNDPLALTEIAWSKLDALSFDLHITTTDNDQHSAAVLGNIVLADHGWWDGIELTDVPSPRPSLPRYDLANRQVSPSVRYRPRFVSREITCSNGGHIPKRDLVVDIPTTNLLIQKPALALPQIYLKDSKGAEWHPRHDLLASDEDDNGFVVEAEEDGTTYLRFGDGTYGRQPSSGTSFTAYLRIGNGRRGNIGAGVLAHLVSTDADLVNHVTSVTNPLPAEGGQDPEKIADVRRKAPYAYQRSERAVRPEDYAEKVCLHPQVQGAVAELRWTGSWYTVFIAVDRRGGGYIDPTLEAELRSHLDKYRMAGHDLEIIDPIDVPLLIELAACLNANASRLAVLAELRQRLLGPCLPGGGIGVFHPDNLTFHQPVYLSALYAALETVPGLAKLTVKRFERMDHPKPSSLADGVIAIEWNEIARLDADPNYPEHGVLRIHLEGGT